MRILWFSLVLAHVSIAEYAKNSEQAWRDPNDPTSGYKTPSKTQLAAPTAQKPDQSLRLILRQMLHELQVDYHLEAPVHRQLHLHLSKHSLSVLNKYLENNSEVEESAQEAVRSALSNIFIVQPDIPDATWQDTFMTIQPFIFTLNLVILPAAAVVVIRAMCRPRNFWILVFSTILFISMYSGYNRKYQEAEAKRFAQFQESSRDACAPEGILSRFVEIMASPFQYRQKSNCLKYIESQTISIFHEISIIEVFSETISSGFFAFMSASAKHLNHFFRDLYDGAPILAQIVMTIFLVLMVGTIRTPLFSYEPIWLTFCSTSIGKVAGWLEGGEELPVVPAINKKEVKRLKNHSESSKKGAELAISPKSEAENEKEMEECGLEKKKKELENQELIGESSEDEEEKDSETEWNEAINSSSLSESSNI